MIRNSVYFSGSPSEDGCIDAIDGNWDFPDDDLYLLSGSLSSISSAEYDTCTSPSPESKEADGQPEVKMSVKFCQVVPSEASSGAVDRGAGSQDSPRVVTNNQEDASCSFGAAAKSADHKKADLQREAATEQTIRKISIEGFTPAKPAVKEIQCELTVTPYQQKLLKSSLSGHSSLRECDIQYNLEQNRVHLSGKIEHFKLVMQSLVQSLYDMVEMEIPLITSDYARFLQEADVQEHFVQFCAGRGIECQIVVNDNIPCVLAKHSKDAEKMVEVFSKEHRIECIATKGSLHGDNLKSMFSQLQNQNFLTMIKLEEGIISIEGMPSSSVELCTSILRGLVGLLSSGASSKICQNVVLEHRLWRFLSKHGLNALKTAVQKAVSVFV